MGPFQRKYNTLTVTGTTAIRIPMIKRGVVDFAVSADWTPASGDVKVLVDGTAAANVTNLPTAVAAGNGAMWEFVLTAAELSCKQCEVVIADSATKAVEDNSFIVETFGNASAMYQADLSLANLPANVVQLLGTAWLAPGTAGTPDVNAKLIGATAQTGRDLGASVLLSTGTGTGQLDFTSGVVKANLAQILGTALTETAGLLAGGFKKFFNISSPAATMDHGVLVDTVTTATTATNLTNAPTSGDLTAAMKTSVTTAATAATPVAASVTGAVGSVTGNVGGNVTGSVGSVVGAVGSVTGAVGSVTAAVTLTTSERNSVADAVLDRDMSLGTDSGSTTVRTLRQAVRFLRNKWAIVAGTLTVTKEDDTTPSWTGTVSTAAGDPVSAVDPAGP